MNAEISVLSRKAVEYWHNDCDIHHINPELTIAINKKRKTVVYAGNWDRNTNLPNGKGKQYKSIGVCERDGGYWVDDTFYSCGKVSYKGDWKHGNKEGFGYNWNLNGCMYKGNWVDNQYSGYGTLFDSNKNIIQKGTWKGGCIYNGYGKKKLKDSIFFMGDIHNGYITSNGDYYNYYSEKLAS